MYKSVFSYIEKSNPLSSHFTLAQNRSGLGMLTAMVNRSLRFRDGTIYCLRDMQRGLFLLQSMFRLSELCVLIEKKKYSQNLSV